mmetsp:Transcript_13104/g.36857  ORF Transcript_13104/g.36857 Transcript_13104/m.36857 type:complete len:522 (-) Transcript_13104:4177-5742(-)
MADEENALYVGAGASEVELQTSVAASDPTAVSLENPDTEVTATPSMPATSTHPPSDNTTSDTGLEPRMLRRTVSDTTLASAPVRSRLQRTISDTTLRTRSQYVPSPQRRQQLLCIRGLRRLSFLVKFSCVLIMSLTTLIIILTFCVVPSIVCMAIGVCLYYTCTDSEEPLSTLLRAMFRGEEANNQHPNRWFGGDEVNWANGNDRARVNRELLRSSLIVRRLLRIENVSWSSTEKGDDARDESSGDMHVNEKLQTGTETKRNAKEGETNQSGFFGTRYPRHHPFSFQTTTERKLLHFSEPLKANVNRDGKEKKNIPAKNEGEEVGGGVDLENGIQNYDAQTNDNSHSTSNISNLQHMEENELGSRSLRETSNNGETQPEHDEGGSNRSEAPTSITNVIETIDASGKRDNTWTTTPSTCAKSTNAENDKNQSAEKIPEIRGHEEEGHFCGCDEDFRDRGTMCDICLLEFEVGDEVAWSPNLNCSHTFHKDCILDWLMRKQSCPSCRLDYLKGNADEYVEMPV